MKEKRNKKYYSSIIYSVAISGVVTYIISFKNSMKFSSSLWNFVAITFLLFLLLFIFSFNRREILISAFLILTSSSLLKFYLLLPEGGGGFRQNVLIYSFPLVLFSFLSSFLLKDKSIYFNFFLPILCFIVAENTFISTSTSTSISRFPKNLFILWFIVSVSSPYLLGNVQKRTQLIKSAAILGIVSLIGIDFKNITLPMVALSVFSPIVSGIFTIGVLPLFEKIFDITTNFTLIELSDFDHPLLVEMRMKAPGTFQHSIVVSDLAYLAAKSVGADSNLVRCAALYHDIGKIVRPAYFIENIISLNSKHDKLSTYMSSKIVVQHVRDGEKMAIAYGLPKRIIDFIKEHHGTTFTEYFLAKTKIVNGEVEENIMRYPGPKPQTIETAILMLADSAEASTRSLEDVSDSKIDNLIDKIVDNKLKARQFDDCNITMSQINTIKSVLKENLKSIHHTRISYEEEKIRELVEKTKEHIEIKRQIDKK